jgi:hypothetical protein
MTNQIKLGDSVSTTVDGHAQTFVVSGKIGNKFRLVVPGIPGVSLLVEPSAVWRR